MKHRMLPFYLLTPSVFAVVSGLGLNFHPASGMEEETEEREEKRRGTSAQLSSKGQLSPVLEGDNEEDGDEDGFLTISKDLFPSNLEEVLTLSDIRKALNYSPDIKELMNPPRRVEFQTYVEALMRRMMQVTGWKIQSSSAFSSSYFYADESAVSEALTRERERVLTLKGRAAQKLQIFISQMENLERFLRDTTQASMPKNEHPSLMPDDIEKTTAWMGGASYLTHSTHLAFLVAPDAIEETLEIFGLLQRAFEKLQSAYTLLSTTLSAKVIDPILKSRLLSIDRKSPLQAWGQLLKVNQEYYEQKTTADLQEPIDDISRGRELLSISPTPSEFPLTKSSPDRTEHPEFNMSAIPEERDSLPNDPLSPVSSESDKFIFEMDESDEDRVPTGVTASLETGDELSVRHPGDNTVNPSPLAQAEITSVHHGSDSEDEFNFTNVAIGLDGESMALSSHEDSENEDKFEHVTKMPSAQLTDLASAAGDLISAPHLENRPHPASPALGVQNDLSVPVDASASVDSPSDPLSDAVPSVDEASPLGDNAENASSDFEDVSSDAASAPHSQARSSAGSPALEVQNNLSVSSDASADLSSPSDVLSVHAPTPVSEVAPLEDTENDLKEFEQVASSEAVSEPHSPARSSTDSPVLVVPVDASEESRSPSEPLSDASVLPLVVEPTSVDDSENDLDAFEQVPSSVAVSASHSPARSSAGSPALDISEVLPVSGDASADLTSLSNVIPTQTLTALVSGALPVEDTDNELVEVSSTNTASAPHSPARSSVDSPVFVSQNDQSGPDEISEPSDVLPVHAIPTPVSEIAPLEEADDDTAFVRVSSSGDVSASLSPARSLAGSPTVNLDGQGQEIEAPSGNPLTPSSNILPDAIIAPPTVLQPQPLQGAAASDDTITEDNKEDVVFVSTVDHESANRALAAQLAAALAEFEEFKRQAALQLSTAEALAQKQLEAEKQQRLLAEQTTQQEKQRRLTVEGLQSAEDTRLTQQALEALGANVVQPIQDMINDFQKKVVAPILASLEDLKSSFSENPEVDQTIIASIRSNVEHIQKAGLESIQSVIDAFKSSFQESKHYLLEPTALLAKAHELVEQIVMAFKDTAAPQKSAIGSSVAPFETLQKFSYGPGLGLTSTQIGMPLSFALIPQESTLLPVGNQTTPPLRIPTLGTASTSSSISGSATLTGLPSTRGSTPSVGTTLQVLSSKAQEITPAMRAWNAQMNRQLQTVHESVNRMTALHKITKVRNRKNVNEGILLQS